MIHIDTVTVIGANGTMGRNVSAILLLLETQKYILSVGQRKNL